MRKNKIALFLVFLIFVAGNLFSKELISTETRSGNGKPDRWIYLKADGGYIIEADNNYDGKIDYRLETDEMGRKVFEEMDFEFTGRMNNFYYYVNGVLARHEIDSNNDGNIDIWIYLEEGIYIVRIERDTDHDGTIDFVRSYK